MEDWQPIGLIPLDSPGDSEEPTPESLGLIPLDEPQQQQKPASSLMGDLFGRAAAPLAGLTSDAAQGAAKFAQSPELAQHLDQLRDKQLREMPRWKPKEANPHISQETRDWHRARIKKMLEDGVEPGQMDSFRNSLHAIGAELQGKDIASIAGAGKELSEDEFNEMLHHIDRPVPIERGLLASGVAGLGQGTAKVGKSIASLVGARDVANALADAEQSRAFRISDKLNDPNTSSWDRWTDLRTYAGLGGSVAPGLAAQIGAGMLGGPAGFMAMGGTLAAGDYQADAIRRLKETNPELSDEERWKMATAGAAIVGPLTAAIDKLPIGSFVRKNPALQKVIAGQAMKAAVTHGGVKGLVKATVQGTKEAGKAGLKEAAAEGMQGAGSDITRWLTENDKSMSPATAAFWGRRLDEAIGGAVAGGGLHAGQSMLYRATRGPLQTGLNPRQVPAGETEAQDPEAGGQRTLPGQPAQQRLLPDLSRSPTRADPSNDPEATAEFNAPDEETLDLPSKRMAETVRANPEAAAAFAQNPSRRNLEKLTGQPARNTDAAARQALAQQVQGELDEPTVDPTGPRWGRNVERPRPPEQIPEMPTSDEMPGAGEPLADSTLANDLTNTPTNQPPEMRRDRVRLQQEAAAALTPTPEGPASTTHPTFRPKPGSLAIWAGVNDSPAAKIARKELDRSARGWQEDPDIIWDEEHKPRTLQILADAQERIDGFEPPERVTDLGEGGKLRLGDEKRPLNTEATRVPTRPVDAIPSQATPEPSGASETPQAKPPAEPAKGGLKVGDAVLANFPGADKYARVLEVRPDGKVIVLYGTRRLSGPLDPKALKADPEKVIDEIVPLDDEPETPKQAETPAESAEPAHKPLFSSKESPPAPKPLFTPPKKGMTPEEFETAAQMPRGVTDIREAARHHGGQWPIIRKTIDQVLASPHAAEILAEIPPGAEFLGNGAKAIAFQTPDGNVVRVGQVAPSPRSDTGERSKHPDVLQPTSSKRFGDLVVEHLPLARTVARNLDETGPFVRQRHAFIKRVTKEFSDKYGINLEEQGLRPEDLVDLHPDNVGMVDGEWKVLDPTAVFDVPPAWLTKALKGGDAKKAWLDRIRETNGGEEVDTPEEGTSDPNTPQTRPEVVPQREEAQPGKGAPEPTAQAEAPAPSQPKPIFTPKQQVAEEGTWGDEKQQKQAAVHLDPNSDEALMLAVRSAAPKSPAREDAAAELHKRYLKPLAANLRKKFSMSKQGAEDAAITALGQAMGISQASFKLAKGDKKGQFKAWLYQIADNHVRSEAKKAKGGLGATVTSEGLDAGKKPVPFTPKGKKPPKRRAAEEISFPPSEEAMAAHREAQDAKRKKADREVLDAIREEIGETPWKDLSNVDRDEILKATDEMHAVKADEVRAWNNAYNSARSQLGPDKVDAIRKMARTSGKKDRSSYVGLDVTARAIASAHPELGWDPDNSEQKLWDMLQEGEKRLPQRADLARELVKQFGLGRDGDLGQKVHAFGIPGLQNVWEKVESGLRGRGDAPKSVQEAAIGVKGRDATVAELVKGGEFALRDLTHALTKVHGWGKVAMRSLPKAAMQDVNAAMKDTTLIPALPQELQAPVRRMRNYLDALSLRLLQSGSIQGPLRATISNNLGLYVSQTYKKWETPDYGRGKLDDATWNKAVAEARVEFPNMPQQELETMLENILTSDLNEEGGKVGNKTLLDVVRHRKDLPDYVKTLYQIEEDPALNFSQTVEKLGRLIATVEMNEKIAAAAQAEGWGVKGIGTKRGHGTSLASGNSIVDAPLKDILVTNAMKEGIDNFFNPKKLLGEHPAGKWAMKFNGLVSLAKTVLSTSTHAANTASAAIGLLAKHPHALVNWGHAGRAMKYLWVDQVGGRGMRAQLDVQKLHKLGILGDTSAGHLVEQALRNVENGTSPLKAGEALARKVLLSPFRVAAGAYSASDSYFKTLDFALTMDMGRDAFPNWPQDQLEQWAAQRVNAENQSYKRQGRWAKLLAETPIGGIGTMYALDSKRMLYNRGANIISDLKSGNRVLQLRAATHLAGLVGVMHAFGAAAGAAARWISGTTAEEEEKAREIRAPWDKNAQVISLGRDESGNLRQWNVSRWTPWGNDTKAINAIFSGDHDTFGQALAAGLNDSLGASIDVKLPVEKIVDIWRGETEMGVPVRNSEQSAGRQAYDGAVHMLGAITPGVWDNYTRLKKAWEGEAAKGKYRRAYNVPDELAGFAGAKPITVDPEASLFYKAREYRARMKTADDILDLAKKKGGDEAAAHAEMEAARRGIHSDFMKTVDAVRVLGNYQDVDGKPNPKLVEILKDAKMAEKDIPDLLAGTYKVRDAGDVPHELAAKAAEDAGGATAEKFAAAEKKRTDKHLQALSAPMPKPTRRMHETKEEWQVRKSEAVAEWESDQEAALQFLRERKIAPEVAAEKGKELFRSKLKSPEARIEHNQRLKKQLFTPRATTGLSSSR